MQFKMKIRDVFFVGPKVIFAGDLETKEKQIIGTECKILVDGVDVEHVWIEGEVFGTGFRDLWTESPVQLKREIVLAHEVWIISA